jgi:hypothetical protein
MTCFCRSRFAFSRLTSTLSEPNALAGNGLQCWIQLSASRLASAETEPMMAVSSRACARRACTAGQYAPCGLHADAMSSSLLRPRLQRSPAIGLALDADPKQRHSLRRGEGHERQLVRRMICVRRVFFNPPLRARWWVKENPPYGLRGMRDSTLLVRMEDMVLRLYGHMTSMSAI